MTIHADAQEQLVIHDKEDNQLLFRNGYLVKVKDKNGNTLTVAWKDYRIASVTDGAGRKTVLTYQIGSDGKLTWLQSVTSPSGKRKQFSYSGGRLVEITDIDGKKISYGYDSRGMLAAVTDIDGYNVKYGYYGTLPYRVKKITEYAGTTEGNSLTLSYGYNSTKFTDNKNRSEICRFNNSGNLLHIHDGFGHAASAKYNRSGNHVNCLENTTKLQSNVVQYLKDPIIQAAKTGWGTITGTGGAGAATINTAAANCKIGTRSLKVESTSLDGYVSWAQDVKLEKGGTYTFSMYVKAAVSQAAADGGARLRVRYIDGKGTWHFIDSEILKGTTDFVRLYRTFTVPADSQDPTVRVYLYMYHAKGVMYGDMAQLEAGSTPGRCNLIDNGDFHTGSRDFTKAGYFEDYLTMTGKANMLPVKRAVSVSASGAYLYGSPSLNGTKLLSVAKGTHLHASIAMTNENLGWYRVETAAGKKGYIPVSHTFAYYAGNDGDNCGAVGISGAVLRSTPADNGAVVEEVIPRGTGVVIHAISTDSAGQKWFRAGIHIDKQRYYGYLKENTVIRFCRNQVTVTMNQADNIFDTPYFSGKVTGSLKAGQNFPIRGVLQNGTQKWYAVRIGKNFCFLNSRYCKLNVQPIVDRLSSEKVTSGVGGLDKYFYCFAGDPQVNKRLGKTLDLTGKKGDTYMVNAWGRGTALPETDNDKNRRFGVEVVFTGADGKNDIHYGSFSPDILDWQFLSDVFVAKQDYTSVRVSYVYYRNANLAYVDGLSLYREEFGQTYTYDDKNNIISAVDAQKNAMKFEYNSSSDLTGITDPKGSKFKYEYDGKHNVVKGTSAMGVVNRLQYDGNGNITRSGTVDPNAQDKGVWISRTFTTDKNHVASVTDAEGNTTRYGWDLSADLLTSLTDGKGNRLNYGHDSAGRLISVSQDVTVDGVKRNVKNVYGYTGDDLTSIDHNGFRYGFAYDGFGNTKSASIAGNQVVGYTYEGKNGNLSKTTYANGNELRYVYDSQDRVTASYFKESAGGTEQKLNSYVYNKEGNLCQVTNHMAGKTYDLEYDFLDRLMRVRDEKGAFYEYTYDANNHMTKLFQQGSAGGASHVTTTYSYDKDGREQETRVSGRISRETQYDSLGRVAGYSLKTAKEIRTEVQYPAGSGNQLRALPSVLKTGNRTFGYQYDANGNITRIQSNPGSGSTVKTDTFQYDERNQMIREDSQTQNRTFVYGYDAGGNLISVKEYGYTTGTLPAAPLKEETGTYASGWKDQLLSWNGTAMTYDAVGNMLTRGDTSYSWTLGRKLAGVSNGKNIRYFYDHTGARTKKTVDGVTTEYNMAGDLLMSETTSRQTLWYTYDSNASLLSIVSGGKHYFYQRNLQNDVIGLIDENGDTVVEYTYDSWGRVLSITGSMKDTLGQQNPFRYRGYYYDRETGLYYVSSRYYDPEIRRFICVDDMELVTATPMNLTDKNLYTYCDNNPVVRIDTDGEFWTIAMGAAIGGVISAGIELGMQLITTGNVDLGSVVIAGIGGAVGGALASTGIGRKGQIIGNAVIGFFSEVTSQVKNGNRNLKNIASHSMKMSAIGAASGFIGGKGIKAQGTAYRKSLDNMKSIKGNVAKAVSNPKGYKRQINRAIKTHQRVSRTAVKSTARSFSLANLFSNIAGRIKNLFGW